MTKQTYGALCALAERHGFVMTEELRAFLRDVEEADQRGQSDPHTFMQKWASVIRSLPMDGRQSAPAVDERELLAQAHEECLGDGPYPTYAQLARMGRGSFTQCALRAIRRAAESRQQPSTAEAVLDYLKANAMPSFQIEVEINADAASLYRKEIITVAFSSWDLLIEHIRTAAQQGAA